MSFSLKEGKILCLLEPSGCGKTTLLRIIAGLEKPDQGKVFFSGADIAQVPPHQRQFGLMFQEFALFPHKNIFSNVVFGLEMQKKSQDEINSRTAETLDLVGLKGFEDRKIDELSGGERQRVALARSLAARPRLLMLDEPLGALDRVLRERLILDLHGILKDVGVTAIFVTHDQSEAFTISDSVAVFESGKILQVGPPEELYLKPDSPSVARFLGFQNFVEGKVLEGGMVQTAFGIFHADVVSANKNETVQLLIRPEAARVLGDSEQAEENEIVIEGTAIERLFQGRHFYLSLRTEIGFEFKFELSNQSPPPLKGEPIRLAVSNIAVVIGSGE